MKICCPTRRPDNFSTLMDIDYGVERHIIPITGQDASINNN
jgi:hypothetical protein